MQDATRHQTPSRTRTRSCTGEAAPVSHGKLAALVSRASHARRHTTSDALEDEDSELCRRGSPCFTRKARSPRLEGVPCKTPHAISRPRGCGLGAVQARQSPFHTESSQPSSRGRPMQDATRHQTPSRTRTRSCAGEAAPVSHGKLAALVSRASHARRHTPSVALEDTGSERCRRGSPCFTRKARSPRPLHAVG
jgi:hypothetical protein